MHNKVFRARFQTDAAWAKAVGFRKVVIVFDRRESLRKYLKRCFHPGKLFISLK